MLLPSLIIITAYTNNLEKEDILRNLVNQLSKINTKFDIMISSHSFVPKDISDKVDYVIYDKENKLLHDPKYKPHLFFVTENLEVNISYTSPPQTLLPVMRLISNSISMANSLGYKKAHIIEYDSILNNTLELEDNDNLLEIYDNILYTHGEEKLNQLKKITGSIQSFKIDKVPSIHTRYNENQILKLYEKYKTNPEFVLHKELIANKNNILYKSIDQLTNSGIEISKILHSSYFNWYSPVYNLNKDTLGIFLRETSFSNPTQNISVIVNDDYFKKLPIPQGVGWWYYTDLCNFSEVQNIKVMVNNILLYNIEFKEDNIEYFKETNNIKFND